MMDDLRLADVAARVVAWHNRHPLARRIAATHVHAMGYVGLPFVGEAGTAAPAAAPPPSAGTATVGVTVMIDLSALEADAAADAADGPVPALASLQPDFSEVFIDTLSPRQVARFAARAGQVLARPPEDGPVREVPAAGAQPGRLQARVYLLTAVIETGTRKSRVLLGTGLASPVLGARVLDTPRVAGLAGLAALVVGVPTWMLRPTATPPQAPAVEAAATAASSAHSYPSAPHALAAEAGASVAGDGALPTPLDATAVRHAAAAAPALFASGAKARVSLISDEDKALARQARQARDAARTASAPSAASSAAAAVSASTASAGAVPEPPPEPLSRRKRRDGPVAPEAPLPAPAPPVASPPPPAAKAIVYALSTRRLRTRAEAEQVQVAMRSLLRTIGAAAVQVDVLPQGDDWRVVALPYARRADAEQARALLVSRGMRVVVVDF